MRILLFLLLWQSPSIVHAQNIVQTEYWIDTSFASRQIILNGGSTQLYFNQTISSSVFTSGAHTLNMRFKYANGVYSVVLSKAFSATQPLHFVKYWLNDDYENHILLPATGFDFNWIASLLFPGASNGAQVLHYMFQEEGGL